MDVGENAREYSIDILWAGIRVAGKLKKQRQAHYETYF